MVIWWFVLIVLVMSMLVLLLSNNEQAGYYATFLGILVLVPACELIFKHVGGWAVFAPEPTAWYEPKTPAPDLNLYYSIIAGYLVLLAIAILSRARLDYNFQASARAALIYFASITVVIGAGFTGWAKYDAAQNAKESLKYRPSGEEKDESALEKFGLPIPSNYDPPVIYNVKYAPEYEQRAYALLYSPDYRGTIYNTNRYRQSSGTKMWQSEMDQTGRDVASGLLNTGYAVYFCKGEEQTYYGTEGTGPRQTYPQPIILGIRADATVMYRICVESPVLDMPPWVELSIFTRNPDVALKEIQRSYPTEPITNASTFKALRLKDG
jgi:hypothetical protein